ncbi:MAG: hypothetical protein AB7O96_18440 [Pseudobdellovibrionaceae bacterium]
MQSFGQVLTLMLDTSDPVQVRSTQIKSKRKENLYAFLDGDSGMSTNEIDTQIWDPILNDWKNGLLLNEAFKNISFPPTKFNGFAFVGFRDNKAYFIQNGDMPIYFTNSQGDLKHLSGSGEHPAVDGAIFILPSRKFLSGLSVESLAEFARAYKFDMKAKKPDGLIGTSVFLYVGPQPRPAWAQ